MNEKERINIICRTEDLEEIDEHLKSNLNTYKSRSDFLIQAGLEKILADRDNNNKAKDSLKTLQYIDSNIELLLQMLVGFMFNNEMAGMDDYYKESVIYNKAQKALNKYYKDKKMNEFTSKQFSSERNNLGFLSNFDEL